MFAALSPARRRLVIMVIGLLVLALVAAVIGVWPSHSSVRAAAQDKPGPVLLVPGYGGATTSLSVLAKTLRTRGFDASVVTLPGDGTGDLAVQAQALERAAVAAILRSGKPSVDVVGYSAGGVVARLWVRDYGGATRARRVITLGSPQHGTEVATLAGSTIGCPTACQELDPDSSLLQNLNAGDETPAGPQFVSIWSTADETVLPPDSARLDGAINLTLQAICVGTTTSHSGLPTDPLVAGLVVRELSGPATTTPTSSDCQDLRN
jgi:triacylglycerol lipase